MFVTFLANIYENKTILIDKYTKIKPCHLNQSPQLLRNESSKIMIFKYFSQKQKKNLLYEYFEILLKFLKSLTKIYRYLYQELLICSRKLSKNGKIVLQRKEIVLFLRSGVRTRIQAIFCQHLNFQILFSHGFLPS